MKRIFDGELLHFNAAYDYLDEISPRPLDSTKRKLPFIEAINLIKLIPVFNLYTLKQASHLYTLAAEVVKHADREYLPQSSSVVLQFMEEYQKKLPITDYYLYLAANAAAKYKSKDILNLFEIAVDNIDLSFSSMSRFSDSRDISDRVLSAAEIISSNLNRDDLAAKVIHSIYPNCDPGEIYFKGDLDIFENEDCSGSSFLRHFSDEILSFYKRNLDADRSGFNVHHESMFDDFAINGMHKEYLEALHIRPRNNLNSVIENAVEDGIPLSREDIKFMLDSKLPRSREDSLNPDYLLLFSAFREDVSDFISPKELSSETNWVNFIRLSGQIGGHKVNSKAAKTFAALYDNYAPSSISLLNTNLEKLVLKSKRYKREKIDFDFEI